MFDLSSRPSKGIACTTAFAVVLAGGAAAFLPNNHCLVSDTMKKVCVQLSQMPLGHIPLEMPPESYTATGTATDTSVSSMTTLSMAT